MLYCGVVDFWCEGVEFGECVFVGFGCYLFEVGDVLLVCFDEVCD